MKKKISSLLIILFICVAALPVTTTVVKAEVKGSTQYLINQAKSSNYVGKTIYGVKKAIKNQGYNGWRMNYQYDWCAWYLSNCANTAYIGNYSGSTAIAKSTFVDSLADNFGAFNGTSKKYPNSYIPKAGDIVVEGNEAHIGIMVSSKKAAYGNDGGNSTWSTSRVKVRYPYNVSYYIPRANWYQVRYIDGLSSTSIKTEMNKIAPTRAVFGVSSDTKSAKFTRSGYTYSQWYIFRQDFNKKSGTYTKYYYSKNNKTGKYGWVKAGTKGYTKYKKNVGSDIKFSYNANFAGAEIILEPVWVRATTPTLKITNDPDTGKSILKWTSAAKDTTFDIYRYTDEEGEFVLLEENYEGTTYTDISAINGTCYKYKVGSDYYNTESKSVARTCDLAKPSLTSISNIASSGGIKIEFEGVENANQYELYRATSKNGTFAYLTEFDCPLDTEGTYHYFVNTKGTPGTTYYYRIKAVNTNNKDATSAFSSYMYRTRDLARPDVTLKYSSSGKIVVTWPKVTGADYYEIYRSVEENDGFVRIYKGTYRSVTNTKNIESGTNYYYMVRAIDKDNSAATSAYSEVQSLIYY